VIRRVSAFVLPFNGGKLKLLTVNNISKVFSSKKKQIKAVNDVSFKLNSGEILGIVGPNGAGKSTLLRMIASLTLPTEGTIKINNNYTSTHNRGIKDDIGYVAVETGLYGSMTSFEFLYYFGRVHGYGKKEAFNRITELASLLDFDYYLYKKISHLSTGMKQKISIARGLLHKPHLLILDEPTNGLDIIAAYYVREIIKKLKQTQTSIIISTHIITDIKMCDRLIVLNKGNLVYESNTMDVINNYNSLEDLFFDVIRYNKNVKMGM
ncbi:ABC transporter ATP-binding protein, partial [Oceanobacillus caeni]